MLAIVTIYVVIAMVYVPALVGACASTLRQSIIWAAITGVLLFIGWDLLIGPDLDDRYGILSEKAGPIVRTWITNSLKAGVTGGLTGAAGYGIKKAITTIKRHVDSMGA